MPDEFAPETLDTGAPDMSGNDLDTAYDESAGYDGAGGDDAEPEKPSKLYAGKYANPEDLEKDYMRVNYENNQLRKKAEESERKAKVETQNEIDPRLQSLFDDRYRVLSNRNPHLDDNEIREMAAEEAYLRFEPIKLREELAQVKESVKRTSDPRFGIVESLVNEPEFEKHGKLNLREQELILSAMEAAQRLSGIPADRKAPPQKIVANQHLMAERGKSFATNSGNTYGVPADEYASLKKRGMSDSALKIYAKEAYGYGR